jgi:hypothetical protein
MEIDVLHGDYLSVTAAGSTALDTEYRSEGRLTECKNGILTNLAHSFCKTYADSCLALSGRSRIDSGNKDEFTILSESKL